MAADFGVLRDQLLNNMKKITFTYIYGFIMLSWSCHTRSYPSPRTERTAYLPYYITPDFAPLWIDNHSKRLDTIHQISPFSFVDQNGNTITEKDIAGRIYVANFFFTSCPGICPQVTKNLKLVQDAFINDSFVMLLSHTVSPSIDNINVLRRYGINYGIQDYKWHLLTGNKEKLYSIARKSYFADEDLGFQKNSNDFLHTENVLLIDQKRRIRGIYKGTSPIEMQHIISDIRVLEQE